MVEKTHLGHADHVKTETERAVTVSSTESLKATDRTSLSSDHTNKSFVIIFINEAQVLAASTCCHVTKNITIGC
jgi:hypothetical protein